MKCPICGAAVRPHASRCRNCGRPLARTNDALKRTMPLSPRLAMLCGAGLAVAGGLLLLYGADEFATVLLGLGLPLALIGLLMR
ncbi:hypothetical protein BerOc1_02665 [Pseudodesulfovibrio hydrargyri]|uniref:Zinc-ribbon domain-containing protein n=1 Tax=Pseudodesulfovibrio hydrargyri TaxID=2125990 RepID=A0A1J5MY14_9BACT|nr:zinc-ribbon domain-containing protein [Pseudodesulfovibrio hydrargyri]OIQ50724.1 hypothetical protein BerOc1_02665 [Pseudodesulfovibrio hydrargyri]